MRSYLIGSWNNADEFDYSGEQLMGSRNGPSVHILPNGKANTQLYADKPVKAKQEDLRPIEIRNIDKLDRAICVNYSNWKKGSISFEEYKAIDNVLQSRHRKLVDRLTKLGYYSNQESETSSPTVAENAFVPYIFDSAINKKLFPVYVYTMKQLFKFTWKIVRRMLK